MGGVKGFDSFLWESTLYMDNPVKLSEFCRLKNNEKDIDFKGVKFTRTSPDGEDGFPGELDVSAWYLLSENN